MAAPPALNQVNLVAADVEATVAFYRRLGLTVRDGPPEWLAHHVTLETASGEIAFEVDSAAFAKVWNRGFEGSVGHGVAVLGFEVATREEVDRLSDELSRAGYKLQQPPYDAFWGARYAVLEDPSGHAVGLMSPVDARRRSYEPPPPG
ncbi:MAG TPA: VOC family protein [Anaeromyxobacteraceae bacterium]|nr:VOC family protein [Anaeromyxobacteraceae bacterium]